MIIDNSHKAHELAPISKGYHDIDAENITWEDLKDIKKPIRSERLRFITNDGFPFYELSYHHIRIDGQRYRIIGAPYQQVPKRKFKSELLKMVKDDGIFIKDLFQTLSILY